MKHKTLKRLETLDHRENQYDKALDGLIAGKIPPEYVHERFEKLKQIKGGK